MFFYDGNDILKYIGTLFLFTSPLIFLSERFDFNFFQYGKFVGNNTSNIESKKGYPYFYIPALVLLQIIYWGFCTYSRWGLSMYGLLTVHYSKRVYETLKVHKYSGNMSLKSLYLISSLYCLNTSLFGYILYSRNGSDYTFSYFDYFIILCWRFSIIGNYMHHKHLAELRNDDNNNDKKNKTYMLPTKYLFKYVCCPHYLCEVIGWWLFAYLFQHFIGYVNAVFMTCYLCGRANRTLKWYKKKFDIGDNWNCIIPFIY